jgi:hypothetical protein
VLTRGSEDFALAMTPRDLRGATSNDSADANLDASFARTHTRRSRGIPSALFGVGRQHYEIGQLTMLTPSVVRSGLSSRPEVHLSA